MVCPLIASRTMRADRAAGGGRAGGEATGAAVAGGSGGKLGGTWFIVGKFALAAF